MYSTAIIFPGQGSQYVGMGKDLYMNHPIAREMYKKADDLIEYPLSKICFEGPEDELKQTRTTQPAIFLHSIILMRLLGISEISMTAGHSLGEYSALVTAQSISWEDGLKIVRKRGELMQKAGEENPGTMAAIVGLSDKTLEEICYEASTDGIVQCANYNSPGQIVISGSVSGVRKAMELAKSRGAKMVKELVVSGAFHSPLMESAREGLKEALQNISIQDAKIPIYSNVDGKPVKDADLIRRNLVEQITSAVLWEQSIRQMIADGATTFIEVGPGKVLQGLVKRIDENINVFGIDKFVDIEKVLAL